MNRLYALFCLLPLLFLHLTCFANFGAGKYAFIENKGQWDPSIHFMTEIPGGKLFLKSTGLHYVFMDRETVDKHHKMQSAGLVSDQIRYDEIEINFDGSNPHPTITGEDKGKTNYNYYLSHDESKWATGCKSFNTVRYYDIYPGIDLRFYTQEHQLKYDLILSSSSDPADVTFSYMLDDLPSLEEGCLYARTKFGTLTEGQPLAYQLDRFNERHFVGCKYELNDNKLTFRFDGELNKAFRTVIDPALIFSTFSGSISDNFGYTACFDEAGNLYSGGIVFGANFPATIGSGFGGGTTDMAILKYDSTGSDLLYATFIGGASGDTPHSLVVNNNNELVIMGTTGSPDYPVSVTAYDRTYNGGRGFLLFEPFQNGTDIVLSKLSSAGQLLASTFVGGPGNDGILKMLNIGNYQNTLIQNYGDYQRGDVIVDENDNVYVASSTDSTGFPISSGIQDTYSGGASDAVAFSLNSNLSALRWSTYLGGQGDDAAYSVKLDEFNHVYLGGGTSSSDFPATQGVLHSSKQGGIDGFITRIDQEGDSILQSTFLGTDVYDQVYFIDIDSEQNIYAFGQTRGDYPITPGAFNVFNSGQFIHKLDAELSTTVFSTVFGSGEPEPNISPTAFLANECENIFLSGWGGIINNNLSSNQGNTFGMPITSDALNTATDGSDFYLMALSADGRELLYSTYFGSTNNSGDHVDGGTSRFDKRGIMYQSVCTCGGSLDNFPVTENAWATVNLGVNVNGVERCNNAAFKFDLASLRARFETNSPEMDAPGIDRGCAPFTVLFTNTSIGGEEQLWAIEDGTVTTAEDTFTHTFQAPGRYTITLTITDENTCTGSDSATKEILVFDDAFGVEEVPAICQGSSIQLQASGGQLYEWEPALGLDDASSPTPVASPQSTTEYVVRITTENGCLTRDTVEVVVIPTIVEEFTVERRNESCEDDPVFAFTNLTESNTDFSWDFGDGTISTERDPIHQYMADGSYIVSLQTEAGCVQEKELTIDYESLFVPNVFTPNGDNKNDFFEVKGDLQLGLKVFSRSGRILYETDAYDNSWDGDNLASDVYFYQLAFPDGETCEGWVQLLR